MLHGVTVPAEDLEIVRCVIVAVFVYVMHLKDFDALIETAFFAVGDESVFSQTRLDVFIMVFLARVQLLPPSLSCGVSCSYFLYRFLDHNVMYNVMIRQSMCKCHILKANSASCRRCNVAHTWLDCQFVKSQHLVNDVIDRDSRSPLLEAQDLSQDWNTDHAIGRYPLLVHAGD